MKRALIYLHLAVFLAGFTGVLGRWITLNESLLVWYRLLITVITLALLSVFQGSFPKVSGRKLLVIFGVGGIVAFHWVSFYGSIKYSNVSIALVCFSTLGFFSSLLEPLLMKKRFSVSEVLLGMLAIAGVYLIFHFDTRYKTGILYGLVSAVLAALFTVLNKSLLKSEDTRTVTFYELTGGFLVLTLLLPFYLKFFNVAFSLPHGLDWFWLLVLSWLCTVLAFYLSLSALRKVSPFTVNLTYNLEPVYGIVLAFVIYHENEYLGPGFYLGLSLIIIAVILQMLRVYLGQRERGRMLATGKVDV
jgi:drug/metabolite transporter (DMT)-like permease